MTPTQSLFFRAVPDGRGPTAADAHQRALLLDAMTRVVVRKGFEKTTVADVTEAAGVSRKAFYEHFLDKEAAFLAAYETGADIVLGAIAGAVRHARGAPWRERLHIAIETWIGTLAAEPQLARLFLLDVVAAGPKAIALRRVVLERFATQLRGLRHTAAAEEPEVGATPDAMVRALVGGMNELVGEHIADHGAASLPRLAPLLEDFAARVLRPPSPGATA